MKSSRNFILQASFLFFTFSAHMTASAQAPTQAYLDYMSGLENYVQNDLYAKVSTILYDAEAAPSAEEYIQFCKGVKAEIGQFYEQNSKGLLEQEKIGAQTFSHTMLLQLGELYLDRAQDLEPRQKLGFLDQYFEGIGLDSDINNLSEDLSRSMMMTLHAAMGIPFGMPNTEVEAYISGMAEPKKELFQAAFILNDMLMLTGGYESSKNQVAGFRNSYPNSIYLADVDKSLSAIEKLKEGAVVENFSFVDLEGKSVSLMDYKDKIIYLDLWASWCGPCINTFRTKTPFFEKKLEGNPEVILMYISIDEQPEPWKNYLSKNKMGGVHLFAGKGFEAEIMKYFKVWGIPRYLIIGKDNKIIDVNAPRPGDEAYEALKEISGI
ncbi:TlpA family protein disulfide reductase [Aquiflexum sp. LQ15W]|uniref:TlpA family protein disulfide reductase n=1 Tax=Cognataquiflexum nitidum TaxID=2922272 RepID=UPI001F13F978|nr:TlpA disulfide reductase family protein [Cognataquiflexum nitidum]MCH6199862.1 TlpA family protein disulfide reductase [Cognataquiflexum nitidum]